MLQIQRFQPLRLWYTRMAVLRLPQIEGRPIDAMLAHDLDHWDAGLALAPNRQDLGFTAPRLPQRLLRRTPTDVSLTRCLSGGSLRAAQPIATTRLKP